MYVSAMLATAVLVLIMANLTEPGEAAGVVEVTVAEHHGLDGPGIDAESFHVRGQAVR